MKDIYILHIYMFLLLLSDHCYVWGIELFVSYFKTACSEVKVADGLRKTQEARSKRKRLIAERGKKQRYAIWKCKRRLQHITLLGMLAQTALNLMLSQRQWTVKTSHPLTFWHNTLGFFFATCRSRNKRHIHNSWRLAYHRVWAAKVYEQPSTSTLFLYAMSVNQHHICRSPPLRFPEDRCFLLRKCKKIWYEIFLSHGPQHLRGSSTAVNKTGPREQLCVREMISVAIWTLGFCLLITS